MPKLLTDDGEVVNYDDGRWYAGTVGHFAGLILNEGDPVVLFRVVGDDSTQDGASIRRFEVVLVPDGHVLTQMHRHGAEYAHRGLAVLMSTGKLT